MMSDYCASNNPEFEAIRKHFIGEVLPKRHNQLSFTEQSLIRLVSLVVQQSVRMLEEQVIFALDQGIAPEAIKEAAYQCAPYVGFPRVMEALTVIDKVMVRKAIALPLKAQGTVEEATRFEKGLEAQVAIFGEGMRQAAEGGEAHMAPSAYYLVTNCFGDYYTRGGLDLKTRELLTLCMLVNLGVEPQIKAHITGNINMGRDKASICDMMYHCLPYMGYPRLLNALRCLDEVMG